MIGRNLSRRLERLEAETIPTGPPVVHEIIFVDADGERTPGPIFEFQPTAAGHKGSWGRSTRERKQW